MIKIGIVINRNNMCGQRFYRSVYKYCLRILLHVVIPKLSWHHIQSECIDVDSFHI
jgi:hypothetical protein